MIRECAGSVPVVSRECPGSVPGGPKRRPKGTIRAYTDCFGPWAAPGEATERRDIRNTREFRWQTAVAFKNSLEIALQSDFDLVSLLKLTTARPW